MKKQLDPYADLDILGTLEVAKKEIIAEIRGIRKMLRASRLRIKRKPNLIRRYKTFELTSSLSQGIEI